MSTDLLPVQFEIVHTTVYNYSAPVAVSHHVAHLNPRGLSYQQHVHHDLQIDPAPAVVKTHTDYFGNTVAFFAMQGAHKRLTVRARSRWSCRQRLGRRRQTRRHGSRSPIARHCRSRRWNFCSTRSRIPANTDMAAYARPSFPPGRPLLDAVLELTRRIHGDFTFDPKATTVKTPLSDVFRSRRGVCQDFARLEIACLRSLGLPARYVSGYLETVPPPGRPRLIGADASHAWLAVYCPGPAGLTSIPPTTCCRPLARDPRVGARLPRCQPDPRGDSRWGQPYAARQR